MLGEFLLMVTVIVLLISQVVVPVIEQRPLWPLFRGRRE